MGWVISVFYDNLKIKFLKGNCLAPSDALYRITPHNSVLLKAQNLFTIHYKNLLQLTGMMR